MNSELIWQEKKGGWDNGCLYANGVSARWSVWDSPPYWKRIVIASKPPNAFRFKTHKELHFATIEDAKAKVAELDFAPS